MHFVPIPTTPAALIETYPLWSQFLPGISRRSKEPIEQLFDKVKNGTTHIGLVWDEIEKKVRALVGMEFYFRGEDKIGHIVWLTGSGMKQWQTLLPQLEDYLRFLGCKEIKPVCRPGWSRMLKEHGYRTTHYVMEKPL